MATLDALTVVVVNNHPHQGPTTGDTMSKQMHIIDTHGVHIATIGRATFASLLFACQWHGVNIGNEGTVVPGQPVPVNTATMVRLSDVLDDLQNEYRNVNLHSAVEDLEVLREILAKGEAITITYA